MVYRFYAAVGCAALVLGATALGAAAQPAGGGSAKDPLKLFEPMYPVFTSQRCANCHGGVDPIQGINHDKIEGVQLDTGNMLPGRDGNSACLECHDESADTSVWRLAPSQVSFVGKDPVSLCRQVRGDNGLSDGDPKSFAAFIDHLSGDQLIGFAFEGRRAMTENDPEPPPVDRATFVNFARRWLQEGKAKCSTWNGTLSEHVVQSAPMTWDVTIDVQIKDGEAFAQVHGAGHMHQTGQGCFMRDDTFTVDSGNTLVPVDVGILLNQDLGVAIPQLPQIQLPPGVPAPPDFASNNGYMLSLRLPPVDGNDHFEQVNQPPSCARTSGDMPFPFTLGNVAINKRFDPKMPDHLHDTDVQQSPAGTITTTWDLSRE